MKKSFTYLFVTFLCCLFLISSCTSKMENVPFSDLIIGRWQLTQSDIEMEECCFTGYTEFQENHILIDHNGCTDTPIETGTWTVVNDSLFITKTNAEKNSFAITSFKEEAMILQGQVLIINFITGGIVIKPVYYHYKKYNQSSVN